MFVCAAAGVEDTINFDMGGTSTEVCVVHRGKPELSHHREIEGFPLRSTAIAVNTIGAGGSSIARVDAGGLLHVGPQSVGADPGPACYGRGGSEPTVTDANVVLGRLNPEFLLGGTLPIDGKRAAAAIEELIARPLRMIRPTIRSWPMAALDRCMRLPLLGSSASRASSFLPGPAFSAPSAC